MGVHARRATRRTTPLVAAAAGIGTVAAMLASPLPASAASLVPDPDYGRDGVAVAGALSTNFGTGLIPTRGVDAVDTTGGGRVVLGQEGVGEHRVTLTAFDPDGDLFDGWGTRGGQTPVVVPSGTTVTNLVSDGSVFWVLGHNSSGIWVGQVAASTGIPVLGAGHTFNYADLALPPASSLTITAAAPHTSSADDGLVVAVNVLSPGTGLRSAKVFRIVESGVALDTSGFGTGGGFMVPGAVGIGGLTVRASGDIVGTYNTAPDPGESTGESLLFELDSGGAPAGLGANATPATVTGYSAAIEAYADGTGGAPGPSKSKWTNEVLGGLIETPDGDLIVAGRVGWGTFLASVGADGTLNTTAFGRYGGVTGGTSGGGGVSTLNTTCTSGLPQVARGNANFYLSIPCSDSHSEIARVLPNGIPDPDFRSGSAVWKANLPVNAGPVTVIAGSPDKLRVGSATLSGADAATAQLVEGSAPAGVQVTGGDAPVVAGNPVTLVAMAAPGAVPAPIFRWETRPDGPGPFLPVINSPRESITGTGGRYLRITTTGSMDGRQYRAIASNGSGDSAPSEPPVTLHVLGLAPLITHQPTSQAGPVDGTVKFTAEAKGDPDPDWSWQWQAPGEITWNDVMPGPNIAGSDSSVLTLKNLLMEQSGTHYRAIATNNADSVVTDGHATLTVGGIVPPEPSTHHAPGDFDGDGKSDPVTFRPSDGSFHWADGTSNMIGRQGDKAVMGDYDGDGKTDAAVYRPSNGTWYIDGQPSVAFGRATDKPEPGDYNGDGKTDPAVYRPSNGMWYVKGMSPVAFGRATDVPVPADYNGDGKTDIAVYRPSNGTWYFLGGTPVPYGRATDVPMPADYNGDGQAEIALFRPTNLCWYIIRKDPVPFGQPGDTPVAGDFDGDGSADIAVYHSVDSTIHVRGTDPVHVGTPGDRPMPH